ncbi:UV excision repair protein RAD23 B [Basidiobolus ranarum]|uniref:UV excision repair protein RAD23 B n=1 Tax=Basidiobolus ranarum TaxID=34480 RepID=A0ABR2W0N1_9FUNG
MTIVNENIVFRLLKPSSPSSSIEQCKSLVIDNFLKYGSLERELRRTYSEEKIRSFLSGYVNNLVEASIPYEISVYALDKVTNQVVGVFLNGNCELEEFEMEYTGDPIIPFLEELDNSYFQNRLNNGQYFHGVMVAVHPDFSRRGIFKNLCLLSFQVALSKKFEFFIAECSSPYTFGTLTKFGATIEASSKYSEFEFKGSRPFRDLEGTCCLVQLDKHQLEAALKQNQLPHIEE